MKRFTKLLSMILAFSMVLCLSGCGSKALDPNRTTEPCSLYGETKVFGSLHDSTHCIPDGDGYWLGGFEHHHHK